jgi:hypothetical protein
MKNHYQNNKIKVLIIFSVIALLLLTLKIIFTFSPYGQQISETRNPFLPYISSSNSIQTEDNKQSLQKIQEQIDLKYCNGPCRFINFLNITEQGKLVL